VFVTNHALAGAAIGALVRRPVPAFVAGVGSHILMDMAPHFGGLDMDGPEFLRAARVDGALGLGVTAAVVAVAPPAVRRSALAGLAGACLIDLDKPGRHFFGRSPFPAVVDRFHGRIQNEVPNGRRIEVATAAVLGVAVGAAFRHRRRRGRAVA
jgi:hypothetical protein